MRDAGWINAYERRNVDIGLACGLRGRAQIGKGMWAMPDLMADMLEAEDRAAAGRSEYCVGTLAHRGDPARPALSPGGRRRTYSTSSLAGRRASLDEYAHRPSWRTGRAGPRTSAAQSSTTTLQSILGYVVRWIDQGIGCSKVPDYHDVA